MAKIDLGTITEPVSEEQPCGPDLDMEFDMDFMNFIAEIEGIIPARYFGWDPNSLDFNKYYELIGDFLERTRDIRILVPLAKLRILQSDLPGFAEVLDAIERLLRERWSEVHPQPAEFLELSMGQLSTLDDMPNVVLPLQHATLVRSRRVGAITLRKWQVATGEVNAREGEETLDADSIRSALSEAETDELDRALGALTKVRDAIAGIRTVSTREGGFDTAPQFERLPPAVDAAIALIEIATGSGGAAEAEVSDATGAEGTVVRLPAGAVASREQAVEALHAAARYFALNEPSSPVPLLLREAEAATSKSFYELLNDLVPDTAGSAFVSLGKDAWINVYLSTLDSRNPAPDYAEEDDGEVAAENSGLGDDDDESEEEVDPADDEVAEEGQADEDASEPDEEAPTEEGDEAEPEEAAEDAEEATDTGEEEAAEEEAAEDEAEPDAPPAPRPAAPRLVANSRAEAVALLDKVLAYYRVAEPTSPVVLLVERAIDMSSKSFIELLGKVLPEGSLNVREE